MAQRATGPTAFKKRLCVLSDGTWNSLENATPSNVVKLTKAISQEDDQGIQQVVHYDAGIGTEGGLDRLTGGALGKGIDTNIQELYTFLALNYEYGDEIYMFGFSRGAYTVRSLGGMIYDAGLVRRDQLQFVKEAYELYRANVGPESVRAVSFRSAHGDRVPITCIVCFETVGALGLPANFGFLADVDRNRYQFHDTTLSPLVQNGIHVLSIDEERSVFKPTPMEGNPSVENQVAELYFWGAHGGVGGADSRQPECGDITLRFVVDELTSKRQLPLKFDQRYLPQSVDPLVEGREIQSEGILSVVDNAFGKYIRTIYDVQQVHSTATLRYQVVQSWRPAALDTVARDLLDVHLNAAAVADEGNK